MALKPACPATGSGRGCLADFSQQEVIHGRLKGVTIGDLQEMTEEELNDNERSYLTTRRWVLDMFDDWGPDDGRYQSRVLGQFPKQSEHALISLEWLENAMEPAKDPGVLVDVGIDVAGPGEDETVMYFACGSAILDMKVFPHSDPRGECMAALRPWHGRLGHLNIDSIVNRLQLRFALQGSGLQGQHGERRGDAQHARAGRQGEVRAPEGSALL